jgi:hypothetical protein
LADALEAVIAADVTFGPVLRRVKAELDFDGVTNRWGLAVTSC